MAAPEAVVSTALRCHPNSVSINTYSRVCLRACYLQWFKRYSFNIVVFSTHKYMLLIKALHNTNHRRIAIRYSPPLYSYSNHYTVTHSTSRLPYQEESSAGSQYETPPKAKK